MGPDDLLCSRNARPGKALVGRAQWKIIQPPSLERNEQAWPHSLPHLAFSEDWSYFSQRSNAACGGSMRGIDFVTNKSGKKTAVLIDLKRHGQLWEDFYDSVVARNRTREPRESLDAVKDRLRRLGKLRG